MIHSMLVDKKTADKSVRGLDICNEMLRVRNHSVYSRHLSLAAVIVATQPKIMVEIKRIVFSLSGNIDTALAPYQ